LGEDVVDAARRRLLAKWFCWLNGRVAEEAVIVEENPDDAATESCDIVATTLLLPFINHGQLENLGEETASTFFSVVLSCQHKINQHLY
jgi:hypothetical protein